MKLDTFDNIIGAVFLHNLVKVSLVLFREDEFGNPSRNRFYYFVLQPAYFRQAIIETGLSSDSKIILNFDIVKQTI